MENPSEPGAGKKPQRANARATGSPRKPPPARRPAAKRPATQKAAPARKTPSTAAEARESVEIRPVVEPPEAELAVVADEALPVEDEPELVDDAGPEPAQEDENPEPTHDDEGEPGPEAPEAVPEVDAEPESAPDAQLEPEAAAEPESDVEPASTLADLAGWARRVASIAAARVGTLSARAAAAMRSGAGSARQRVTAAQERAATARAAAQERAAQARAAIEERRERAALVAVEVAPSVIDETIEFDLDPTAGAAEFVLTVTGLTKSFDDTVAVAGIDLRVPPGAFYGIVGPNGAGKTTTLSMITGLLRPDSGSVIVHGADVWTDPVVAKRNMGVLPDRLRLFDRLTGAQLLYYAGVLRGLDGPTARQRSQDLARVFGLEEAQGRLVSDYSAGMTKKIALAAALIHAPRLLVLDEPFESVDPVSAANVTSILRQYVAAGGTVVLSSHSMDLVQRICDHVAVVVGGVILADGTVDEVRDGRSLEERFVELAGSRTTVEGLEWLHGFSD